MKYLKRYHESFNPEQIVSEVKDILLELEDCGFEIIVKTPITRCVYVKITKSEVGEREAFLWSDVEDYLVRVCDYLSQFGFRAFDGWGKTESIRRRTTVPQQGELAHWYSSEVETETKCWVKFISDFSVD